MTPKTHSIGHPFRANVMQELCVVCATRALVRCPRCRRPFCSDHATVSACCPDCELQLTESTRRWTLGTTLGYLAVAGGAASYLSLANVCLGVVAGAFGVLGGIFVSAVARRLARGAHRSWEPVENAELRIGAEAGEARQRRLGWLFRSSGKKDMYQAAYDAGFNRVQGCA